MSYQGARETPSKIPEKQHISVRDHMATNLITFTADQTVEDAAKELMEANISGAPVLDNDGKLLGIISEGDCLKALMSEKYHNHPSTGETVGDCMVTQVIHISPETDIFEAARMFLELRVRRFPVLDKSDKVIGQISQKDVIMAMNKVNGQTW